MPTRPRRNRLRKPYGQLRPIGGDGGSVHDSNTPGHCLMAGVDLNSSFTPACAWVIAPVGRNSWCGVATPRGNGGGESFAGTGGLYGPTTDGGRLGRRSTDWVGAPAAPPRAPTVRRAQQAHESARPCPGREQDRHEK